MSQLNFATWNVHIYLCLSVGVPHVGTEVQTGAVHAARGAGDVWPEMWHVPLRGRLHLTELTAEGDYSAPQGEQTTVFGWEVLVEGLENMNVSYSKKLFDCYGFAIYLIKWKTDECLIQNIQNGITFISICRNHNGAA